MRNESSSTATHQHQQQHQLLSAVDDVPRSRSGDSTEPVDTHHPSSHPGGKSDHHHQHHHHNMIPYSPVRLTKSTSTSTSTTASSSAVLTPARNAPSSLLSPSPYTPAAAATTTTSATNTTITSEQSNSNFLPALVTPLRPGMMAAGPPTLPQRRTRSMNMNMNMNTTSMDNMDMDRAMESAAPMPTATATSTASTTVSTAVEEGPWRTKELSGVFRQDPFSFFIPRRTTTTVADQSDHQPMDYDDDDEDHIVLVRDQPYPDLLSIGRSYAFDEDDAEF